MDPRVARAIERIHDGLWGPLALPSVARAAGLSSRQLCRLFKDETGLTPRSYLKRARLIWARLLLERPDLSIKQTAPLVGRSDLSHFVRYFKRAYGASPAEIRKAPASLTAGGTPLRG